MEGGLCGYWLRLKVVFYTVLYCFMPHLLILPNWLLTRLLEGS